jgi:hypothetical protein
MDCLAFGVISRAFKLVMEYCRAGRTKKDQIAKASCASDSKRKRKDQNPVALDQFFVPPDTFLQGLEAKP